MNVVVESGDENRPFVCEILKLYKTGFRPMALVQWYYWPEDTNSGRIHFHGDNELFKSDHRDWIEVSTIINSCKIYSFVEYEVRESRAYIHTCQCLHPCRDGGGRNGWS